MGRKRDSSSRGSMTTIDILRRVRPSIRFCLLSRDVRSKGEAFPSKRFRLKKFNVVQPKTPIISLFVREMLRPYQCQQNHSGTGRRTSSKFPVPNSQSNHVTTLIIHGTSRGSAPRNDDSLPPKLRLTNIRITINASSHSQFQVPNKYSIITMFRNII